MSFLNCLRILNLARQLFSVDRPVSFILLDLKTVNEYFGMLEKIFFRGWTGIEFGQPKGCSGSKSIEQSVAVGSILLFVYDGFPEVSPQLQT